MASAQGWWLALSSSWQCLLTPTQHIVTSHQHPACPGRGSLVMNSHQPMETPLGTDRVVQEPREVSSLGTAGRAHHTAKLDWNLDAFVSIEPGS